MSVTPVGSLTFATGGGVGISDGDKGDIVVSGTGAVWTFDSAVVTSAGRAILDDVDAAAQRATLGLGTIATASAGDYVLTSAFAESVDDRVAALLVAGSNITLTYNDAAGTLTIAASGGGGSANVGTATIDFGAFPGATDASVAVTGQAGILAGSTVKAWLVPTATADHSADEHIMASAQIDIVAGNIVAGTGFTIYAVARHLGAEPLQPPGIGRVAKANATAGLNTGWAQGVEGSVGGADLSRQYGQYSIAWEWV